jgi:aspartyl-tRNA(Asn)/glutamyl-tRNA(Gln) amidotransferase subunit A
VKNRFAEEGRPVDPFSSIAELSDLICRQEVSPVAIVLDCLQRIEASQPTLNAFITVLADQAFKDAMVAEAEIKTGHWRGPLHGVPIAVKDMFDTAGIRTTAAFEHFKERIPARDAAAVRKLKQAGAIIVGKTNMHKLAMGTTSVDSYFGAVHNPWNKDFIAGGSSGGSAAAVAAGLCYAALDTDAIGSCRLPASCCGVTGFKGTYGVIPNTGILEGEPVEDTILWLSHAAVTTRSAIDAALLLNVLAEVHPPLSTAGKLRIGVVRNFEVEEQIATAFVTAVETLRNLGNVIEVTAPIASPGFDIRNIEADRKKIAGLLFKEIDVIVLPTTAAPTPKIEQVAQQDLALSAQNTLFANYYGLPAVSVPCGVDLAGLPLGLQIVGPPGGDHTVLRAAQVYQQATPWSRLHPA